MLEQRLSDTIFVEVIHGEIILSDRSYYSKEGRVTLSMEEYNELKRYIETRVTGEKHD